MLLLYLFLPVAVSSFGNLVQPGIMEQTVELESGRPVFLAYERSAFAKTQLEVQVSCGEITESEAFNYKMQVVVRSSPCDREFNNLFRMEKADQDRAFELYFSGPTSQKGTEKVYVPSPYDYKEIAFYKSERTPKTCDSEHDTQFLEEGAAVWKAKVTNINASTSVILSRRKRQAEGTAVEVTKGAPTTEPITEQPEQQNSLSSKKVFIELPVDAVYLVLIRLERDNSKTPVHNMTVEVEWQSPHGYLSAIDWPLLPFYGAMCVLYGVYAMAWFIVSLCQWKELLRIQFWIGAVILLGMVEKAVFYSEYQTVNATGRSVEGAIQLAELVSCLKRTLSRMLIIIVSVGFGVVKPRLGATLHKVVGVGFVYFILCAIEGVSRVSKNQPEAVKQKQLVALPLILLEVAIFWWIFTSLANTMRALRLRRNEVKLSLYRHFTNTLIFASVASVGFMIWSLAKHIFTDCLKDWEELWVDTAFWHLLFCVILLVIMILWRPTNNNQRYAFTPLLDHADDDDEEDTIFSEAFTTAEQMKLRGITPETRAESRKDRNRDPEASIEDELKWVEENIPSSMADKLMADSDEEAQQTRFEISKMQ